MNLGFMIGRRGVVVVSCHGNTCNSNVHYHHRFRRFYNNYRWHNYTQNQQPHQTAHFSKKAKKSKESAAVVVVVATSKLPSTTTTSTSTTKNLRRTKKDHRTETATGGNNTMIPVPSSLEHNLRSLKKLESETAGKNTSTSITNIISLLPVSTMTPVYVHPLSQIVLQCLQSCHHEWVQSKQLNDSLVIHDDGTFAIGAKHASNDQYNSNTIQSRQLQQQRPTSVEHSDVISKITNDPIAMMDSRTPTRKTTNITRTIPHYKNSIKVWTTYGVNEQKHWLCVSVNSDFVDTNHHGQSSSVPVTLLRHRYLLQDNSLTPWKSFCQRASSGSTKYSSSIPDRIYTHVYDLIGAVNKCT